MILEKMRFCFWKLQLGFSTNVGFDNYHIIAVRHYVLVPKFWQTWRTSKNNIR